MHVKCEHLVRYMLFECLPDKIVIISIVNDSRIRINSMNLNNQLLQYFNSNLDFRILMENRHKDASGSLAGTQAHQQFQIELLE